MLKVKDLVNSCQNQWQGLFDYNPLFKIIFKFQEVENIETYTRDEFNNYNIEGVRNHYIFNKINQRHEQEVLAWEMLDRNTIEILVKEF